MQLSLSMPVGDHGNRMTIVVSALRSLPTKALTLWWSGPFLFVLRFRFGRRRIRIPSIELLCLFLPNKGIAGFEDFSDE